MSQESKAVLISLLGSKTVSYKAEFAKALGSVPAAVMLSQAFFWQENARFKTERVKIGDEVYFAKTSKEWEEETGLSKDQQHTARKVLVAAGMMKEIKYGMPAVMHFRMDVDATVDGITRYSKTGSIYDGKPVTQLTANQRTSGGRFRRIEDGNPDAIKESLNSIESKGGEANEAKNTPAPAPNFTPFEEEEKEKNKVPAAADFGGAAGANIGLDYPLFGDSACVRSSVVLMSETPKVSAADAIEADGIISAWSAENLETVKFWHERSKRIFSLQEYDKLLLKFCGYYANHKDDGTQKRFLSNPLLFFRNQFSGWLVDQPKFDRAQAHPAPSPQRGIEAGSLPKNLRRV